SAGENEDGVEVGLRAGRAIEEGADQAKLLGEHEEGGKRRRAGEGAEDADGTARPAGGDRRVERVGRTTHGLDDEVDGRVDVAPDPVRVIVVDHAVGAEGERGRL